MYVRVYTYLCIPFNTCMTYFHAEKGNELKEKGNELYKKQMFPQALKAYDEALKINPNEIAYLTNKACTSCVLC